MSTTTQNAPVGSWLKVSTALENVLISHDSDGAIHVYVGASAPDANSAYHRCRRTSPFAMGGVVGVDVYVRSGRTFEIACTVTAV